MLFGIKREDIDKITAYLKKSRMMYHVKKNDTAFFFDFLLYNLVLVCLDLLYRCNISESIDDLKIIPELYYYLYPNMLQGIDLKKKTF